MKPSGTEGEAAPEARELLLPRRDMRESRFSLITLVSLVFGSSSNEPSRLGKPTWQILSK